MNISVPQVKLGGLESETDRHTFMSSSSKYKTNLGDN